MPTFNEIFVLCTLVISLLLMAFEIFPIDLTLLLLTWIYVPIGIIKVSEATAGFASEGLITVMVLYPVALAIERSGILEPVERFFTLGYSKRKAQGKTISERSLLFRIAFVTIFTSAFYNNTPQVAMFIPVMQELSRKLKIAPSKLMLPLSYASIAGGCLALVGTSTNLLALSLAQKARPQEFANFGQFTIALVGGPVALATLLYLAVLGPTILPSRQGTTSIVANPREYVIAATVSGDNIAGKTLKQAKISSLLNVSLISIEKGGVKQAAPSKETILQEGDVLWFAGQLDDLVSLKTISGLVVQGNDSESVNLRRLPTGTNIYEAVISHNSPLINTTVGNYSFRETYKGAVIAVHRDGKRVEEPLHTFPLKSGDILLVLAQDNFLHENTSAPHFHTVFSIIRPAIQNLHKSLPWWKKALAIIPFLIALVFSSIEGKVSLSLAAGGIFSVAILLFARIITPDETRQSLDWSVFIAIGTSIGLGSAMTNSGAAALLANALLNLTKGAGELGLFIALYVVQVLLNAIVSNNASVTLVFPIIQSALQTRAAQMAPNDPNFVIPMFPYVLVLMLAGSADFSTPIGYQTNMMVLGPGGYRFSDYLIFGLPLQVISGFFTIAVVSSLNTWWVWTLVLGLANVVVWGVLEFGDAVGLYTRFPVLEKFSFRRRAGKGGDDLEGGEVLGGVKESGFLASSGSSGSRETILDRDAAAAAAGEEVVVETREK
ncbi:Phosphoinositide phosphatase sac1 [Chytridiales sp. JEL 0842]|nr:Phosphoinositide phosphatase sac1 [Chytridiales sp. JEL 0842]